jgi:hypothetical protein
MKGGNDSEILNKNEAFGQIDLMRFLYVLLDRGQSWFHAIRQNKGVKARVAGVGRGIDHLVEDKDGRGAVGCHPLFRSGGIQSEKRQFAQQSNIARKLVSNNNSSSRREANKATNKKPYSPLQM